MQKKKINDLKNTKYKKYTSQKTKD